MAGFDPNMVNQALAAQGYGYRVPALEEAQANAAQFPSLPQAGAETSMLEQAASAQSMPAWSPGQVSPAFSMVPPPEQQVVLPTEQPPAAAPAQEEPAQEPKYTPEEIQMLLARQRQQGGGGGASPIGRMLDDASERAKTAETEAKGYEAAGDQAMAEAQQAEADIGQARANAATEIAKVQDRMAAETQPYLEKLYDLETAHVRAREREENKQRDIAQFMSTYEPKDRRTMGQKVMGALAVGLGQMTDQNNLVAGLMQGMNVQTNNADSTSALIQRGIDRDLEMQRAMLDNKRTALAASQTLVGQLDAKFGQEVDTLSLGKAIKLEQAIQEMEAIKSRGLAGEQLAVADRAIANLALERDNLMMGIRQQNFERYKAQEDQLTLAKWRQSQAPRGASPMEQAKYEEQLLKNEKARQELAAGPEGKPLSAEEKKQRSILGGQDSAARDLALAIAGGDGGPGSIAKSMPDLVRSERSLSDQASEDALIAMVLRHESGASISDGDIKAKRSGYGLDSSDPEVRLRGRRQLLEDFNSRRASVGLEPIEPVVRRGAAK